MRKNTRSTRRKVHLLSTAIQRRAVCRDSGERVDEKYSCRPRSTNAAGPAPGRIRCAVLRSCDKYYRARPSSGSRPWTICRGRTSKSLGDGKRRFFRRQKSGTAIGRTAGVEMIIMTAGGILCDVTAPQRRAGIVGYLIIYTG